MDHIVWLISSSTARAFIFKDSSILESRLVHIAVGTPGRLCSLLQSGTLPPRTISTLVLDEADTLLSEAFYSDVTWAYDQLPKRKQVGGTRLSSNTYITHIRI